MLDKLKIHNLKLHAGIYFGLGVAESGFGEKLDKELFSEIEWQLYEQVHLQLKGKIGRQLQNQLFRQITIQIKAHPNAK